MSKREIYVTERDQKKKYFFHETYSTWEEALLIGKYYKKEDGSKYFVLVDTWSDKVTKFHLYLDNIWNAL